MGKYQGNTSSCLVLVHTKTDITISGVPGEFSTGGPMVNGPLWCPMMSVSLFFRLMMGVRDVGENRYRMNPDALRFWLHRNVSVMV